MIKLYAFSLQQDEPGINPILKVWDVSRIDKNGVPFCFRISKIVSGSRPAQVSALCVDEGLQFMSVGFVDGTVILYRYILKLQVLPKEIDILFFRGDVTRDRSSKQKVLKTSSSIITGLAFKTTSTTIFLFVATDSSVIVYNISQKDKEHKVI